MNRIIKKQRSKRLQIFGTTLLGILSLTACILIITSYLNGVSGFVRTIADVGINRTATEITSWVANKKTTVSNLEKGVIAFSGYPEALRLYFKDIMSSDPDFLDVYFGTAETADNSGYLLIGSGSVPPVGFDWTVRPWFTKAAGLSGTVITAPYIDVITGRLVFSISKRVYSGGKFIGVISADIYTDTVKQIVASARVTKNSSMSVLNSSGVYLTHENIEKIGKNTIFDDYGKLFTQKDQSLILSGQFFIDDSLANGTYFASVGLTEMGWILTANGQLSDFHDSTRTILFLSGIIIFLASVFLFLLIRSWLQYSQLLMAQVVIEKHNKELEQTVADRTYSLRNILDNTGQGFFTFGANFIISPGYSKGCSDIFGKAIEGLTVTDILFPGKETTAEDFKQGFELYFNDQAKAAIIFDLTDKVTTIRDKIVSIEYKETANKEILCILTDITTETALVERNKQESDRQKRILRALNHKHFFAEYLTEAEALFSTVELFADKIPSESEFGDLLRTLHTFKGNSGFFGFNETQEMAHDSEVLIADSHVLQLKFSYHDFSLGLKRVYFKELKAITDTMGENWIEEASGVIIPRDAYYKITNYVSSKLTAEKKLIHYLEYYRKVSFKELFSRLPYIAAATADKIGKKIIPMNIFGSNFRVIPERYQPLAESCIHIVNNMVDHGIEFPYEREAVQKLPTGKIELMITLDKSILTLEFSDDGRGVNVKEVERLARSKGLLKEGLSYSPSDILNVLFEPGFSTKAEATKISGRGIGLSAVKEEVLKLGGTIEVRTKLGKGSTFEIALPLKE